MEIERLIQRAERGDAKAQFRVGECYHYGYVLPKNMDKAMKLYREAIAQDHANAIFNLALCYNKRAQATQRPTEGGLMEGGLMHDKVRAFELFKMAADRGVVDALCGLARCYLKGVGVAKDKDRAIEVYRTAAAHGVSVAELFLEDLTSESSCSDLPELID